MIVIKLSSFSFQKIVSNQTFKNCIVFPLFCLDNLYLPPGDGYPTPDCVRGQFPCHCPDGYFYEFPQNTCEPHAPGEGGGQPIFAQPHDPTLYGPGHEMDKGVNIWEYDYFGSVDGKHKF